MVGGLRINAVFIGVRKKLNCFYKKKKIKKKKKKKKKTPLKMKYKLSGWNKEIPGSF